MQTYAVGKIKTFVMGLKVYFLVKDRLHEKAKHFYSINYMGICYIAIS